MKNKPFFIQSRLDFIERKPLSMKSGPGFRAGEAPITESEAAFIDREPLLSKSWPPSSGKPARFDKKLARFDKKQACFSSKQARLSSGRIIS